MIQTRDAHTDDEAWMIEKLNQEGDDIDRFNPRDFKVAVDEDTGERKAFGRTEYVRNVDDTEFVEINSVFILDRAEYEHGCILLADLAEEATNINRRQVFAFPYEDHEQFKDVGFEGVNEDQLPAVMQERYAEKIEKYGKDSVVPMTADMGSIGFELEDEEEEFEKPEGTTDEEVEQIKEELDIDDDPDTKYQV